MGDDLGEEWWLHEDAAEKEEVQGEEQVVEEEEPEKPATEKTNTKTKPEKRKKITEKTVKAKKKKKSEQQSEGVIPQKKETEEDKSSKPKKKRRKKKTITDVLSTTEPKPGSPADLQSLMSHFFSDKRSVIEQEELNLPDSCFLSCNDLTHSLSSYLKLVCPKWAKIHKQHTEKSSVILLIVCCSALRTIELIKQMTTFKGEAKAIKLFAKHIKIEEQAALLQKGVTHIGVGTPGRISALLEKESLNLQASRYVVLDWNWRDKKLRRMVDIPEIKLDLMKLLEHDVLTGCRENKLKIGLF